MYQLNPLIFLTENRITRAIRNGELSPKSVEILYKKGLYKPFKKVIGNSVTSGELIGQGKRIDKLLNGKSIALVSNTAPLTRSYSGVINPLSSTYQQLKASKDPLTGRTYGAVLSIPGMKRTMRSIESPLNDELQVPFGKYVKSKLPYPSRYITSTHEADELISGLTTFKNPKFRKELATFIKKCRAKGMSRKEIINEYNRVFTRMGKELSPAEKRIMKLTGTITAGHNPGVLDQEIKRRRLIEPLMKKSGLDPKRGLGYTEYKIGPFTFKDQAKRTKKEFDDVLPYKQDLARRIKLLRDYK